MPDFPVTVPRPVRTGQTHFMVSQAEYWQDLSQFHQPLMQARRMGAGVRWPPQLNSAGPDYAVPARVDHNRWIADCPSCRCAEFIWHNALWFMCQNCYNVDVGGLWKPVTIPDNWAEIEAVLKERPQPENRNWSPAETVEMLVRENLDHGLREGI